MRLAFLLVLAAHATVAAASDYKVGDHLPPAAASHPATDFRAVEWDDLLPQDWNPMQMIRELNLDALQDSDPRAIEAMRQLKALWNDAPANPAMNGAAIRIAGFAVPLEWKHEAIKEFLLVPYFGACIHVPPPPANQIIHVAVDPPYTVTGYMDAVWVSGMLSTGTAQTTRGESVYRLRAHKVEAYEAPPH